MSMTNTCPSCGDSTSLRKVIYGLPDGPLDETKYVTGGCCRSEKDPITSCINCGWEGDFKNHMQSFNSTDLST